MGRLMIDQLAFILSPRDSGLGIYHLAWLLWMMLPVSARNKALLDALQLEGPLGPLPVSVAELYATRAFYSSYSSSVEHDLWYVGGRSGGMRDPLLVCRNRNCVHRGYAIAWLVPTGNVGYTPPPSALFRASLAGLLRCCGPSMSDDL